MRDGVNAVLLARTLDRGAVLFIMPEAIFAMYLSCVFLFECVNEQNTAPNARNSPASKSPRSWQGI